MSLRSQRAASDVFDPPGSPSHTPGKAGGTKGSAVSSSTPALSSQGMATSAGKPSFDTTDAADSSSSLRQTRTPKEWSIAIHGGSGVLVEPGTEREQQYHDLLEHSLQAGATVLEAGGSSEEAVVAAVGLMEDSPLFNCGHGSSVTMKGTV